MTAGLYLRAITRVFWGEANEKWSAMPDLDRGEMWVILPLLALTILIGVAPATLINLIHVTMASLGF